MKYEYKYVVQNELLSDLRRAIFPFVKKDPYMDIGGPSGYTIRSIYYDTPKFDFYHEKIDGLNIRKKIRIRGYNEYDDKNIVFLEIKRKNEKLLWKNRASVAYRNLNDLLTTGNTEKYVLTDTGIKNALEDSRRFLFHIHKSYLQRTVLVIYEREAFFCKFNKSLRITFDKRLRSSMYPEIKMLYREENIKYTIPGYFILEVKFHPFFPSWMASIIASFGLKLETFSKFTRCID